MDERYHRLYQGPSPFEWNSNSALRNVSGRISREVLDDDGRGHFATSGTASTRGGQRALVRTKQAPIEEGYHSINDGQHDNRNEDGRQDDGRNYHRDEDCGASWPMHQKPHQESKHALSLSRGGAEKAEEVYLIASLVFPVDGEYSSSLFPATLPDPASPPSPSLRNGATVAAGWGGGMAETVSSLVGVSPRWSVARATREIVETKDLWPSVCPALMEEQRRGTSEGKGGRGGRRNDEDEVPRGGFIRRRVLIRVFYSCDGHSVGDRDMYTERLCNCLVPANAIYSEGEEEDRKTIVLDALARLELIKDDFRYPPLLLEPRMQPLPDTFRHSNGDRGGSISRVKVHVNLLKCWDHRTAHRGNSTETAIPRSAAKTTEKQEQRERQLVSFNPSHQGGVVAEERKMNDESRPRNSRETVIPTSAAKTTKKQEQRERQFVSFNPSQQGGVVAEQRKMNDESRPPDGACTPDHGRRPRISCTGEGVNGDKVAEPPITFPRRSQNHPKDSVLPNVGAAAITKEKPKSAGGLESQVGPLARINIPITEAATLGSKRDPGVDDDGRVSNKRARNDLEENPRQELSAELMMGKGLKDHDQWRFRLEELRQYKEEHGDCLVPRKYPQNRRLGTWVSGQRTRYKMLKAGKPCSLTPQKIRELEAIGFAWTGYRPCRIIQSNSERWHARFEELRQYKAEHGDCLVPRKFAQNRKLAEWVTSQRKLYKILKEGKRCSLSPQRVQQLEALGFAWTGKPEPGVDA